MKRKIDSQLDSFCTKQNNFIPFALFVEIFPSFWNFLGVSRIIILIIIIIVKTCDKLLTVFINLG